MFGHRRWANTHGVRPSVQRHIQRDIQLVRSDGGLWPSYIALTVEYDAHGEFQAIRLNDCDMFEV